MAGGRMGVRRLALAAGMVVAVLCACAVERVSAFPASTDPFTYTQVGRARECVCGCLSLCLSVCLSLSTIA